MQLYATLAHNSQIEGARTAEFIPTLKTNVIHSESSETDSKLWDSPESVAAYSGEPHLVRSERAAFDSCFSRGLEGRRVLDLGCGGGRTTHFLHEMGADVVGVDISQNLIRAAKQRAPQIDFRLGEAESLEFDDESFDLVVFSFNGLDYLHPKSKRCKAIREMWRVLCPNGRLIFSHHNLAAFFFGWYKFMRPWKLRFRAKHILNGNALKNECYIRELPASGPGALIAYHAWPTQVIADLRSLGFELESIHSNSLLLAFLQRALRITVLTKLADPWPYYTFVKRNSPR